MGARPTPRRGAASARYRWALGLGLLQGLAALACVPESIFDPLGTEPEGESSETAGFVGERPAFVDPTDGRERLRADRRADLSLRVRGTRSGSTVVLLDGVTLGTLPAGHHLGELQDSRLVLHFDGALTVGVHALELFNPGDVQGGLSAPVALEIEASPTPQFVLSASSSPVAAARELTESDDPEHRALAWVGDPADPSASATLSIAGPDGAGAWALEDALTVDLPGYVAMGDANPSLTVAADELGFRVAWSVGASGERVDYARVDLDGTLDAAATAFQATDPKLADREWIQLGRPRQLGRQLVVPVRAPADTESEAPGDRALWTAQWRADGLGAFARVPSPAFDDLEAWGTLVDLRPEPERAHALALVGGSWIRGLGANRDLPGLFRSDPSRTHRTPIDAGQRWFSGVAGVLGSRTTFAHDDAGQARVIHEALFAERSSYLRLEDQLPALAPTAAISPAVVAGLPVFAIPYGNDAPMHLVSSDGSRLRVHPAPFSCDAVVLSASAVANADTDDPQRLPLVCLRGGALFEGAVETVSP